jgi:hypothetical protein
MQQRYVHSIVIILHTLCLFEFCSSYHLFSNERGFTAHKQSTLPQHGDEKWLVNIGAENRSSSAVGRSSSVGGCGSCYGSGYCIVEPAFEILTF